MDRSWLMSNKKVSITKDFKSEFNKIEWPQKEYVVRSSIITIFMVIFFTIYVAASDFLLSSFIFGVRN